LNATNSALQPHAGGLIGWWSEPAADEIRDDQGISLHNPDTNVFMKYKLAGAYDSNIALILTHGEDRLDSYERLAEILRTTNLIGEDLCTNLEFHYGLTNWFIGTHIQARPTTKFIVPYLTAVGLLKQAANDLDLDYLFKAIRQRALSAAEQDCQQAVASVIDRKQSLLLRPLKLLLEQPHALAGWLSLHHADFVVGDADAGCAVTWQCNPIDLLDDLYHYLNMDYRDGRPALDIIWDHDFKILFDALQFYRSLEKVLPSESFVELSNMLSESAPSGMEAAQWSDIQAAHKGYQAAMDILAVLPYLAGKTHFYELKVADDLSIDIPDALLDETLQKAMAKVLVPPLAAKSDEILASSGGMFYPREAPGMEVYVKEGDHFEAGDVLYIVEVMKMFNKVLAPFAGTIEKVLVEDDGVIIAKGQTLFKIKPDEEIIIEAPETIAARKREYSDGFLALN
jgi:biotin carboxyl carrier protein